MTNMMEDEWCGEGDESDGVEMNMGQVFEEALDATFCRGSASKGMPIPAHDKKWAECGLPDEVLVAQARYSPAAIGLLIERHYPRIWRFCMAKLRNAADADEAADDTFIAVNKQAGKLNPRKSFSALLHKIASRRCMDVFRKRRRQAAQQEKHAGYMAVECSDYYCPDECSPVVAAMWECFDELLPGNQVLLAMRFIEGYTPKEIAEHLCVPCARVYVRLAKILARMRTLMEGKGFHVPNGKRKATE